MKRLTRLGALAAIGGIAVACLALTGPTSPALAVTPTTVTLPFALGAQLGGDNNLYAVKAITSSDFARLQAPAASGNGPATTYSSLAAAQGQALTATFPAPNQTGSVSTESGGITYCLDLVQGTSSVNGIPAANAIRWTACTGGASQQWTTSQLTTGPYAGKWNLVQSGLWLNANFNSSNALLAPSTAGPGYVYIPGLEAAAPVITTTSLASGTSGQAYSQTVQATGTGPITFSVSSGSLPAGLTLNTSTGEISGTPSGSGSSTFTITATNSSGSGSKTYTVTVADMPIVDPAIAGGAAVLAASLGGVMLWRRRREDALTN